MDGGFDAIVIGSGIGGLTAAAALAKRRQRVLVLEKHTRSGGLTQTFHRGDYTFATGVHYIGGMGPGPGPEARVGRLFDWLTDGRLAFAGIGSPYDIVRWPGFEFPIEAPRERYMARLKDTFPREAAAIDGWFARGDAAAGAMGSLYASGALPWPLGRALRAWRSRAIASHVGTTVAQALAPIADRRLAALLASRWADHGVPPTEAPFAVHALVTGSYLEGAYYPVGGPARFAEALGETIAGAGGEVRVVSPVQGIEVRGARACGVRLADGSTIPAAVVISDIGALQTAGALPAGAAPAWRAGLEALRPGCSYCALFVGLRGDVRAAGATPGNHWIYESDDVARTWDRPLDERAPSLFVSFASLKDPLHPTGTAHTAEIVAPCPWEPFARWSASERRQRPQEYEEAKARIAERLLAQFERHFPGLAPLVDFHEAATPLSHASYVGARQGAMYGLALTADRLLGGRISPRTPVPGLFLAGQDAAGPGIQGAAMGGFMAASAVVPSLWKEMRG